MTTNNSIPNILKFQGKVLLGIDFGTIQIGLAIIKVGREPFPIALATIVSKNKKQTILEIKQYIENEAVDVIVLGLPTFADGKPSEMTIKVEKFGEEIKNLFPDLVLYYQDETLSSFEASDRMKKSPQFNFKVDLKRIDEVAATIILEDFLKN